MENTRRALKLLGYPSFRALGHPRLLPLNLTVSVTYTCTSRCQSCDIWKKKVHDLQVDEYAKVFRSLGRSPLWVTVSGGDQFLREDLPEIFRLVRHVMQPSVINLPMNGILTKRIETLLPEIARNTVGSSLVLNLSIDEIGERHDVLRGHKHNYEKILRTFHFVRALQKEFRHITLGIHTVISKFNVERLPEIYHELQKLGPDSFLTEIAEARVELGTMAKDIAPTPGAYAGAVDFLSAQMRKKRSRHPTGRLVESLRLEYYQLVKRTLAAQPEYSYALSNAKQEPLKKLVQVGSQRHWIEVLFQEGKGEVGLGHYEVRSWVGWHHHMTLSMLALWFLILEKCRIGKKNPGHHGPAGAADIHEAPAIPAPAANRHCR